MNFFVDIVRQYRIEFNQRGGDRMQWNLIKLRKQRKLYQEHIAKLLGISVGSYGMKERGEVEFTADEMFKLSHFFNLSIEKIFLPRNFGVTEVMEG